MTCVATLLMTKGAPRGQPQLSAWQPATLLFQAHDILSHGHTNNTPKHQNTPKPTCVIKPFLQHLLQ